jgi:hypothetical protein
MLTDNSVLVRSPPPQSVYIAANNLRNQNVPWPTCNVS